MTNEELIQILNTKDPKARVAIKTWYHTTGPYFIDPELSGDVDDNGNNVIVLATVYY